MGDIRRAMLDEEGIRQFCEQAACNLDGFGENEWRLLLEKIRLRVEVTPGESVVACMALPSQASDNGAIVYQSSAL